MAYGEQFEYKVVDFYWVDNAADLEKELNELGFQGWELVAKSNYLIFKRKK